MQLQCLLVSFPPFLPILAAPGLPPFAAVCPVSDVVLDPTDGNAVQTAAVAQPPAPRPQTSAPTDAAAAGDAHGGGQPNGTAPS